MAKRGGSIWGWLLLLALGIGWCSSDHEPRQAAQPQTAARPPPAQEQRAKPPARIPERVPDQQPVQKPATDPVRQRAVLPPPTPATPSPTAEQAPIVLRTISNVRLRESPSTSSRIIWTAPSGTEVRSTRTEGQWHHVSVLDYSGWMHGDFLREQQPSHPVQRQAQRPSRPQVAPAPSAPLVSAPAPVRSRSGEPIRDPYVGRCDCPYDLMRNGRLCGGRSAYSRPGGRNPSCYH